ncbi:MAG TPA: hypothetical protein VNA12_06270 [Mycobacteriales bacterium]|nr:hypothetical protein [Mycobacteriales bacterium]
MTDEARTRLPADPAEFWADAVLPERGVVEDGAPDALDERGQPPVELGGGGLRRELEAMYAVLRADASARRRWLDD